MRDLFAEDPDRFERFSLRTDELVFDYSKNILTEKTLTLLLQLAEQSGMEEAIAAMFRGDKINRSENRPVLHVALRNRSNRPIEVDGEDVMPAVNAVLAKMRRFSDEVRGGIRRGFTGEVFTDVVSIGIGGSNLGPRMVTRALAPYADGTMRVHFVSNVDPTDAVETLDRLNPATTLFLIASKSFTTQETMLNAHTARRWLLDAAGDETAVAKHFVALSTNREAVRSFGIDEDNMFVFWDWVGGRFSMWSSIGLSIALYLGMDVFESLLAGAHKADEHFRTTPLERNIPVLMGLIGVWYTNFWGADTHAVLPYDQYLDRFNDYVQQIDTESNGKRVTDAGEPVAWDTGPVVWGRHGTDGQHAFYQLIHQGTRLVPCDFLATARARNPRGEQHEVLLAHFLAQSEALMQGRSEEETRAELSSAGYTGRRLEALVAAKTFPGNKPSNSFLLKELTPETVGMIAALYEHKVFVQGVVWGINSFDQMGVELGKELAEGILPVLTGRKGLGPSNSSTKGLIDAYMDWR